MHLKVTPFSPTLGVAVAFAPCSSIVAFIIDSHSDLKVYLSLSTKPRIRNDYGNKQHT